MLLGMGGTLDPETGEIVWEFHVPLEEQERYYAEHPPSALKDWSPVAIPLPDHPFDGHREPVNVAFTVSCRCGGTAFTAEGSFEDEDDAYDDDPVPLPESPVDLRCAACGDCRLLFDSLEHGYDGVLNSSAASVEAPLPRHPLHGPHERPYEVLVRFEFPSDVLGDADYGGREHDLFSWITVVARDPETGVLTTVFEWECA